MSTIVSPSLLSANFLALGVDMEMINQSQAEWIHVDVMDGVFVPNISYGFPVLDAIAPVSKKKADVHLMIIEPWKYFERFQKSGAYMLTIHYEACSDTLNAIQQIRALGMKVGLSLKPDTSISVLESIIHELDMVLIMSVFPGFGGQSFIAETLNRVSQTKAMIIEKGLKTLIQVDGGVDITIGKALVEQGADVLVAGSSIFKAPDPTAYIKALSEL